MITLITRITMLSVIAFMLLFRSASAQSTKLSYSQLKEYEGEYQYIKQTTLKIAASPREELLYAIINESRYPLKPQGDDNFRNAGNELVHFFRNDDHVISGYITGQDTFKLLNKHVSFPVEMWYPRLVDHPESYTYEYKVPATTNDGINVGTINGTDLNPALLSQMMLKIVKGEYPNVRSMLIVKNDKLVFEEYFYDYNRDKLQEMRSASKSIISALTGIAIQQKLIAGVDIRLGNLLPQYQFANPSPLKDRITLKDMLDNQSGVAYDIANPKLAGSETAMNYSPDWIKYTYDLPMVDTPGMIGRYNSGNPIAVARIIELRSGISLHDYAAKYLFNPMGIRNFEWNFKPDQSNAENFGQVYLTPRDMAKFGLLYLNGGRWKHKAIVPENWVRESTSKHSVVQNVDYGYFWWLKYLDSKNRRYQSIAAQGNGGQKIYIFKELKMVVVTTGGNYNSKSPSDELIKDYILPAFDKQ